MPDNPNVGDDTFIHGDSNKVREDLQGNNAKESCPDHPGAFVEMGYGLAGGGLGPYTYCGECGRLLSKFQDTED